MINKSIARRYAGGLFLLGIEKDMLEQLGNELRLVQETLDKEVDLTKVLEHKLISPTEKVELIRQVFGDSVSGEVISFLGIIIQKNRQNYIFNIAEEFGLLVDEAQGIAGVDLLTAAPLEQDVESKLVSQLEGLLKKKIRLRKIVNPELLGGMVINVGDQRIDASLKRQLYDIRGVMRG